MPAWFWMLRRLSRKVEFASREAEDEDAGIEAVLVEGQLGTVAPQVALPELGVSEGARLRRGGAGVEEN